MGNTTKYIKQAAQMIKPMVDERRRLYDQYGTNYPGKPARCYRSPLFVSTNAGGQNDALTWMMDVAEGPANRPEEFAARLLHFNFAGSIFFPI
jgi:hypothetical protein